MASKRTFRTLAALQHENPLGLPKAQTGTAPAKAARSPITGLPRRQRIPGVENIIAVASGKGGVGKSTTAVNLAIGLSKLKKAVGILDADLFGPSVPRMMGINGSPEVNEKGQLIPLKNYGIGIMSMGLLAGQDSAVVWRGLMVMKALEQFLREVEWGNLDVLVIDLPPGTGDTQISISQYVPITGAVIVSTPQEVALGAVRKGVDMFQKVNVPILGIVENMSYYMCGHCNERTYLFGKDGVKRTAEKLGVPILGEIPIEAAVAETSDNGKPNNSLKILAIVLSNSESVSAKAFMTIAENTLVQLDKLKSPKQA